MCEQNYDKKEIAELKQEVDRLNKHIHTLREVLYSNANREFNLTNRFFTVEQNTFILDNSFDFDAGLKVSGDFIDNEKTKYAEMIANALNNVSKLQEENEILKEYLSHSRKYLKNLPKEVLTLIEQLK